MEDEKKKKLSANDAIIMMVDAVNKNRMTDFYKVVEQYSNNYISGNDTRYRLIRLIRERPLQMQLLDNLSTDIKKLIIQSAGSEENVFLNDSIKILIEELLLEWSNVDSYKFHNLQIRNRILLHGETGNGKTTIAKYIAAKTNLPLVEVKSEEVIDSHLGSTGANIWKIFNSIKEPCVLFWDEVDSIGCKRGTDVKGSAGHENDRMTNSVLVNLDKLPEEVIFVAATNRRQVLDSAFVRRFDVLFEVVPPIREEKERFCDQLLEYYKVPCKAPELDNLKSYADIKNEILFMARTHVANELKSKLAISN